ncbi:phenylalanine ammonia-lyase [Athelia psychrophila]|uniref:Phenylalanine ammonia-lyase n=1 Tax=Athelia psychrophila TaxID=1759441 RepID=A0A166QV93_9AGAM|nr:phenylalanine ammonia-lyase [Fibularhizoctonia sp. CBS 109695]
MLPPSPLSSESLSSERSSNTLLQKFVDSYRELASYRNGTPVTINGHSLSISAVTAAARYGASVQLTDSAATKDLVKKSRAVIDHKVTSGTSVYGVTTGFGGSADTRTSDDLALGNALLQHQHSGVLPSSVDLPLSALPLLDPLTSSSMPESWVRGAILIRMNSLIRGHSGVRWELVEKMGELLKANVVPLVPLRGSISASGDLSPLSYIAGTLIANPSIRCFSGPASFGPRSILSSTVALAQAGIKPLPLKSKEHLGILNGTAFSASVASLALNDAVHLALMAQVLTAMGVEALIGTRGSFDEFIHDVARPHPGQIEAAKNIWDLLEGSTFATTHEEEVSIEEDEGVLRQDRYSLRTSPQFLGPQIEDLLSALETITIECNSTTDNPLVDGLTGNVHHGGNFQAMAVTNAMERTRLALHHIGKLMFAQCTELINPSQNRGLPPNLAATDPSLNYHAKGIDIGIAAYVGELGYLANPVSTHIQSAEMHNQAVNSLALISGRATINSLDVLTIVIASYLYVLCQALDLRALQSELYRGLDAIVADELLHSFPASTLPATGHTILLRTVRKVMRETLDATSTMDAKDRMVKVAASSTASIIDYFTGPAVATSADLVAAFTAIPTFRSGVASRASTLLEDLRADYLSGAKGAAPASRFLNKTRPIYEFVRITLGIRMHGVENQSSFAHGLGEEDVTIGQNVSLIQEAMRDGKLQAVVVSLFD